MSDLKYAERLKLEELFEMGSGFVLDFSDRTLGEFVFESTGKDIYNEAGTYAFNGQSKAKRLRALWKVEPNHAVGKLTTDMLELCSKADAGMLEDCRRIAERLQTGAPVPELAAITPQTAERSLELLAAQVKDAIDSNQPETGVDRLHAYAVNYMRQRCDERGIAYDRKTPLHSMFGAYANALKDAGLIDSKMGVQIVRSVGKTFDTYNDVRNNHSLAHDNQVLGYDEALLIYNTVCGVIRFLNSIEAKAADTSDSIPF